MGSKHLKQLLNEDQEPFVLKNYIDERRSQIKRPKTQQLHLNKRKPISENSSIFCKNACFFSFHDSPDINRMSPLFDFTSPAKSPIRNSNTLFVHIPSRTAALLLEAALRIQKQSATTKKPKTPKNIGFGFFGSILKRLTHRKKNPKRGNINGDETPNVSVKDILRWDSYNGRKQTTEVIQGRKKKEEMTMGVEEIRVSEMGFSCSCNNSRFSSAWSESNEEKSLDTSSSRSEDSEEMEFIKNGDFSSCENDFCSSPFRFVLERNSSSGRCTPEFSSPVSSPTRLKKQTVKEEDGQLNYAEKEFEEEEEKEQFSPVSVLDPQFEEEDDEDDEDNHEEEDEDEDEAEAEDEEEKDGHQLERSFAVVHRARQQLLHKLRRFERLAELDPIELEKRMAEEEDDQEEDIGEELYDDDNDNDSVLLLDSTDKGDFSVREDFCESNFCNIGSMRIPSNMKSLVLDLMAEEQGDEDKVCKRLDSWKEVESNTIDMMVELDFRSEGDEWKKTREQLGEAAMDIELEIFSFLVQEISDELIRSSC